VTGEGQGPTDKWVAKTDAKFAYGYDKGSQLGRWFGVRGIPHAVLIDPNGVIVWRGNPSTLKAKTIEPHLEGALSRPISDWPESASKVVKQLGKREYKKALGEAEKLDGEERTDILASLDSLFNGKRNAVEGWMKTADYLAVEEYGKAYAKQLKGLPQGDAIKDVLDRLDDDDDAQDMLDAQRKVAKLMSGKIKKSQRNKVKKQLQAIAARFPDGGAGRDAKAALMKLR
jgi:hypothetical protein